MRYVLIIAVATFFIVGCSEKQSRYKAIVQSELDKEVTRDNPGILVAVNAPDNNIIFSGASGVSDIESKTELKRSQTFRIASVTKTFVAATILRLWEDNRLNLDDAITKYISKNHTDTLKSGGYDVDNITIRHLLTHSSGMSEHTSSYKFKADFLKARHVWFRTEQVNDLIKFSEPAGGVGERFSYSDTGYILLGEIIEHVTGKSMGNAITEQLKLKELGLNDIYMEDFDGDFTGRRVHQYHEGVDTYNFHPSLDYYGGGGLLSTTADLCGFFQSLFNNRVFNNRSTLDTMLKPVEYDTEQPLDYRMGIWRIEIDGKEAFTHSGFWGTQVVYIPEIKTAIAANYSQRWQNGGIAPVIPKVLKIISDKK
ncbi:MAG: beta-lactamase family protein [Bacteroidales bacterium]|jgi:D-alanyl-D-alanine carboxypeptidase|nr:beta-lactamase family protein [Bacteroidales bacterium]